MAYSVVAAHLHHLRQGLNKMMMATIIPITTMWTTTTIAFDHSKMDEEDARQQQHSIEEISMRISTACQSLSIQGLWDNASASATLCSMERVEMEVNMYLGDATGERKSMEGWGT